MSQVDGVLTEAGLLEVWEAGLGRSGAEQAMLLARLVRPGGSDAAGDLTVGQRNALLLDLREACFGPTLECLAECPQCADELDVCLGVGELRAPAGPRAEGCLRAAGRQVRFRALTCADLALGDPAAADARTALLRRAIVAVEGWQDEDGAEELPQEVLEAVAARLAALDPGADPQVTLDCPHCGHSWQAALDLAEHLWAELHGYARRLLHDVHALARAYGWTESDVLSVGPVRRRYYLEAAAG